MRGPVPEQAGIGLRAPHLAQICEERPALAWLEAHAENYLNPGWSRDRLIELAGHYPLSLHAVGLSLGSADGLDPTHLARLRDLVESVKPALVSEHLAWSVQDGHFFNDLLPLPYTDETLAVVADNVARLQDALGRRVLIENPSTYLTFRHSTIPEAEFLAALVERCDCGLLLDLNNLHVCAVNHGFDPAAWLAGLPMAAVGEIHLAGHARNWAGELEILIDDHGSPVDEPVWALFRSVVTQIGARPTLIEWDTEIPALSVLAGEAAMAQAILAGCGGKADGRAAA